MKMKKKTNTMAKGKEIMMMEKMEKNTLPQDIIIEILSRVPAESLLSSFKFVCKAWRTLIKDPDFIKMHLSRLAIDGGDRGRSLIRKPKLGNALFQLHPSLNCDQPPFVFEDLPISEATKLDFDFDLLSPIPNLLSCSRLSRDFESDVDFDPSSSKLVCSCNGLLCLSVNDDESVIVLNPSTRKYKLSPKEPIDRANDKSVTYGFGCHYNSTTRIDEYKVIRIAYFYHYHVNNRAPFQINIYSVSSNSWRRVNDIPCEISHDRAGIFLNGAVHWMGSNRGYDYIWDTIVTFNIRDEEFGQVPVATNVDVVVDNSDDVILMNMRGYLGMIYCSHIEKMDIDLEIWVMKEYGIGESWTKEFVIRTLDSDPCRELPAGFSINVRCIMTCFWTADQILIQGKYLLVGHRAGSSCDEWRRYGRSILYDMNKKKINEDFLLYGIPYAHWDEQVDHIDTLVSWKPPLLPLSNNRRRRRKRTNRH